MENQTLNQRLLELIDDFGGPSAMSHALKLANPQLFYNLKNRPDSKPNSETIEKVLSLVPDANMNWLYKGVGPKYLKAAQPLLPPPASETDLLATDDVEALKRTIAKQQATIDKQEAKIDKLEAKNDKLTTALLEMAHPDLFTDKEGIKIESSSYFTARPDQLSLFATVPMAAGVK